MHVLNGGVHTILSGLKSRHVRNGFNKEQTESRKHFLLHSSKRFLRRKLSCSANTAGRWIDVTVKTSQKIKERRLKHSHQALETWAGWKKITGVQGEAPPVEIIPKQESKNKN